MLVRFGLELNIPLAKGLPIVGSTFSFFTATDAFGSSFSPPYKILEIMFIFLLESLSSNCLSN